MSDSKAKTLDVERYPKLTNTRDGAYIKNALNPQGLQIIENILQAYGGGKIDIEVVRDENDQIEFDESGSLIVKDESYVETGLESLVIKWYEDMEDTGYLVECFDEYARNKMLDKAVCLINEVCADADGKEIFGIANIVYMLKESEEFLTQNELLRLTARIHEASWMSVVPLLQAERIDAVRSLLEYGITENKSPEFPSATPEQAKELLLNCDLEVFIDLIDAVAVDNQSFYAPDVGRLSEEQLQPVKDAILAVVDKKPGLDDVIAEAKTSGRAAAGPRKAVSEQELISSNKEIDR